MHLAVIEIYKGGYLLTLFLMVLWQTCQLMKPINHSGFIVLLWFYLFLHFPVLSQSLFSAEDLKMFTSEATGDI